MSMTNAELRARCSRIGTMLEIDGANPFRVRAYSEGARVVENHGEPLAALADEPGALEALPGASARTSRGTIRELVATGHTRGHGRAAEEVSRTRW